MNSKHVLVAIVAVVLGSIAVAALYGASTGDLDGSVAVGVVGGVVAGLLEVLRRLAGRNGGSSLPPPSTALPLIVGPALELLTRAGGLLGGGGP